MILRFQKYFPIPEKGSVFFLHAMLYNYHNNETDT